MALTIKGLNTGVIRHNDKFIALALKVKSLRNKETLLFFPVLALRDLLIGLEHRLYLPHSLPDQEQEKRQKAKIVMCVKCTKIFRQYSVKSWKRPILISALNLYRLAIMQKNY